MEVNAMRRDPPEVILPAVMTALEAGRSLNSITTGRGGHALIVRLYKLRKFMAANPEWSARAAPLIERNQGPPKRVREAGGNPGRIATTAIRCTMHISSIIKVIGIVSAEHATERRRAP
jgi:hypothetical protein